MKFFTLNELKKIRHMIARAKDVSKNPVEQLAYLTMFFLSYAVDSEIKHMESHHEDK